MSKLVKLLAVCAMSAAMVGAFGCKQEETPESAADKAEEAMDDAAAAGEKAMDDMEDAME